MGGSSKKVTVGYKYYLGMQMVLCHGPIDFVRTVRVDDRVAWIGFANGGQIYINKPDLFGGENREGGVVGRVDIEMGGPTQGRNDYLQARLGNDIPAYRGVVSAVLRQVYLGNNPYLKRWAFRAQRITTTADGQEQWYSSKAAIGSIDDSALYIMLDISNSMQNVTGNGKTRLENMKVGMENALSPLLSLPHNSSIDIMVVGFAGGAVTIIRRGASGADVQDIIDWINARDYSDVSNGETDFRVATSYATNFFNGVGNKKPVSLLLTDGEPASSDHATNEEIMEESALNLFATADLRSYGINIDLSDTTYTAYLDNTANDGIPVVDGGNTSAIEQAVANTIFAHFDMNPAHIIRECLTDSTWGMGYLEADVDDVSFTECADRLHSESMGMSLLWDRQIAIEDFIKEVIRHINATLYIDRVSGKYTLKLIRNDYDVNDLLILDESNIAKVSDYSRVDPGDSINSVSVIYWDQRTGENASVTADDPAMIQAYGAVVNTSVQYPGFTNPSLAGRAAARDLQTLSSPLLSCKIEANREAASLNLGDVFKFYYSKYHDGYVLMRVHQLAFGDGKKNRVKVTASEDVFALPTISIMGQEDAEWVEPGGPPLPPPVQIAVEAPYYELVQQLGQIQIDNLLAHASEIGYLQTAATRPDNGINAQVWVDDGGGYEDGGPLDFAPSGKLATDVSKLETSWTLTDFEDLDHVEIGSHGQVGGELFRVDALDPDTGVLTVGRAILDTVPELHSMGDTVVFWDLYSSRNTVEYVEGEILKVKVLTNISQGQLDLANGIESTVTMDQRAFRPYRPANLAATDDELQSYKEPPLSWYPTYPVIISWVERNRLQETDGNFLSWEDATITPELNTEYVVTVEAIDDNGAVVGTVVQVTQTALEYSLTETTVGATWAQYPFMRVTVEALRDGAVLSWKGSQIQFRGPFREPQDFGAIYFAPTMPDVNETKLIP